MLQIEVKILSRRNTSRRNWSRQNGRRRNRSRRTRMLPLRLLSWLNINTVKYLLCISSQHFIIRLTDKVPPIATCLLSFIKINKTSFYVCSKAPSTSAPLGLVPFYLLSFRLLPFCLLPFCLLPFCLLSAISPTPAKCDLNSVQWD